MANVTADAGMAVAPPFLTRLGQWLRELTPFKVFSLLISLALAFLVIYPFGRVLLRLFYADGRVELRAFRETLALPDLTTILMNTVIVVVASGCLALVIGSVLSWLNERTDARMGVITDVMPLLTFLLPPIAGAIGWLLLVSPRAGLLNAFLRWILEPLGLNFIGPGGLARGPFDIFTWWGLIFVYTLYLVPLVFLMISAGLRNMDPSLEEQSQVCGSSMLRTIRKVTLPGLRPSLGAGILLAVWFGFAVFSIPVIIGTGAQIEVLSVRIVRLLSFTFPARTDVAVGLSLFVILAVGSAYLMQVKVLGKGHYATVGGRGHRHTRIQLGRWRWIARAGMVGYILMAAILPFIALVLVALNNFWTPSINWSALTLDSFRRVLFWEIATQRGIRNSVMLGVIGGTIAMVAAGMVALFVQRYRSAGTTLIDSVIKLPAAVSNVVLAVGFILAFSGPPFNLQGTWLILMLAYVALYMPNASVAADAAAGQVGKELSEASYVSGAGGARTFRKVSLPIMLPGLMAGWALVFVLMAGDLSASAILSGLRNPVVGFRILEIYQGGSFAALAALACVLTLISSTVVAVVMWLTRRRTAFGSL